MGSDKASLLFAGETLMTRVVAVASAVGEAVVIGRAEAEGATAVPDLRTGPLGPLAGLETALSVADGRDVVLLGVDQPFVEEQTLRSLLSLAGDAVVPQASGSMQVTCAVYREACRPHVTRLLDEGRRAPASLLDVVTARIVAHPEWLAWGEDGRSWFSVDTPAALDDGIRRFGPITEVRSDHG